MGRVRLIMRRRALARRAVRRVVYGKRHPWGGHSLRSMFTWSIFRWARRATAKSPQQSAGKW